MGTDLQLKARDRSIDMLLQLSKLSLTLGAAMIPLVLATSARKDIDNPGFVVAGAIIYLISGMIGIWVTKAKVERDSDDARHVGLSEQILTYPLIYAKNKLIFYPNNLDYLNEHIKADWNITHQSKESPEKRKPSILADALLFSFVIASMLVAGALPFDMHWYRALFAVIVIIMIVLICIDYRRAVNNQEELDDKRGQIAKLKIDFAKWRDEQMGQ